MIKSQILCQKVSLLLHKECEKKFRSKISITKLKYKNKVIDKTGFSGHF